MSQQEFKRKVKEVRKKRQNFPKEVLVILEALHNQATQGICSKERPHPTVRRTSFCRMLCGIPTIFDFTNVIKWEAWKSLGNMPPNIAREKYIGLAKDNIQNVDLISG